MSFITDHPLLVAVGAMILFGLWKFVLQPIMNEGLPLDPTEEQVEGNYDLTGVGGGK